MLFHQKGGITMSKVAEFYLPEEYNLPRFPVPTKCKHENTTFQDEEFDTNTPQSLTCDDCGIDLPLPEYDPDIDND